MVQDCPSLLTPSAAVACRQTHEPPAQTSPSRATSSTSLYHDRPPLLSQTPRSSLPSPGSPEEVKQPLKTAVTSLKRVGPWQFTSAERVVQASATASRTTQSLPCSSDACVCCSDHLAALFQKENCLQFKSSMQRDSKKGAIS